MLLQLSGAGVSTRGTKSLLDLGISTIAPQYFKDLVQQAPVQDAADITLQQYASTATQYIIQLSLHLHKL